MSTRRRWPSGRVSTSPTCSIARPAIEKKEEINLDYAIRNTNRAVGTMLSGLIASKYGEEGLPDDTINIKFKGSAGQSFGAFLVHGVSFKLEGETNDYFGKGLSGGRISILPPIRSSATQVPSPLWRVPVTTAVST